jgi:hypothetical protein
MNNRESYEDLKKKNVDIESRIKIMDRQRKSFRQHKFAEFVSKKNSSKMDEKQFQRKFHKIMKKDEKVETTIEKI